MLMSYAINATRPILRIENSLKLNDSNKLRRFQLMRSAEMKSNYSFDCGILAASLLSGASRLPAAKIFLGSSSFLAAL